MNWKLFCLAGAAMLAGCADMGGLMPQGALRTLPTHLPGGMDGFYVARFKRAGG